MTRIPVSAMIGLFLTGLFLFTALFALARDGSLFRWQRCNRSRLLWLG